jgi:hypothetical protein
VVMIDLLSTSSEHEEEEEIVSENGRMIEE